MGKYLNLKGKRFGKLTAQYRVEDGVRGYAKWLCQCDCGNQKVCTAQQLKAGHVTSCGPIEAIRIETPVNFSTIFWKGIYRLQIISSFVFVLDASRMV